MFKSVGPCPGCGLQRLGYAPIPAMMQEHSEIIMKSKIRFIKNNRKDGVRFSRLRMKMRMRGILVKNMGKVVLCRTRDDTFVR